jgi:hypothetical protein
LAYCTACSSLLTVSWSLLTVALAEARFASRVAELSGELDEDELELSLEPPEDDPLVFEAVGSLFWVVLGVVVGLGVVVVEGVVVVGAAVVVVGAAFVLFVGVVAAAASIAV